MSATRPDQPQGRPTAARRGRTIRPAAETLENRQLLTGYYPVVGDYNGDKVDDVASFRFDTLDPNNAQSQQIVGRNAILMQLSGSGQATGFEVGYNKDKPVAGDFDGDGKTDVAVYGFANNIVFGTTYGPPTGVLGPNGLATAGYPTNAFPNGSGRFAYIPSSGIYPTHNAGAVNGTVDLAIARMVIVNLGGAGDVPAVADYDGDGKADFAVYQPTKGQFLFYGSRTFNPNADPTQPGNAPQVFAVGKVGDVPASADYAGVGSAQFATYNAASGTFTIRAPDGTPLSVPLGGPGDVPTPGDFEGIGRADLAVYDPSRGVFLVRPADGSATRTVAVGLAGDTPVVGRYGDGRVDFATYTPSTGQTHVVQFAAAPVFQTRALPDPDLIPIQRTDEPTRGAHAVLKADTSNPSVLFLGDSISYRWPIENPTTWRDRIGQFNPSNHSLAADTTQNLLWRIRDGELDNLRPWVVVLNVGSNDFVDRTPAQVAKTMGALITEIHAHIPNTRVLLLDLLPRGTNDPASAGEYLGAYQYITALTRDLDQNYLSKLALPFNQRNLAQYPNADYSFDLQPYLSANLADPTNYFANPALYHTDFQHPNALGTDVWANAIATPLRLLLHRQAVASDYDGDGRSDLAIYAPALGSFFTHYSTTGITGAVAYGFAGPGQTIPAPGDYDGDGRTDYAVYIPTLGLYALNTSSTNTPVQIPFGIAGVGQGIPAPGDYDGDGRADLAVYEPGTGSFRIHSSANNGTGLIPFGAAGSGQSIPVPGDFDGDGQTDLAVYIPALGALAYRPSSGGGDVIMPFGIPGTGTTIPVAGDFDGDSRSDPAVYIPVLGAFVVRQSTTGRDVATYLGRAGVGNAIPAPGDYDGDAKTDLSVFDPTFGTMTIRFSGSSTVASFAYGPAGPGATLPVTARYIATPSPLIGTAKPAGEVVTTASLFPPTLASSSTTTTAAASRRLGPTVPARSGVRSNPGVVPTSAASRSVRLPQAIPTTTPAAAGLARRATARGPATSQQGPTVRTLSSASATPGQEVQLGSLGKITRTDASPAVTRGVAPTTAGRVPSLTISAAGKLSRPSADSPVARTVAPSPGSQTQAITVSASGMITRTSGSAPVARVLAPAPATRENSGSANSARTLPSASTVAASGATRSLLVRA